MRTAGTSTLIHDGSGRTCSWRPHEPFVEETWVGREIEVGSSRLRVVERIERCRMIDLAQDGVETPARWLTLLAGERDLSLAVYADVSAPGTISVGDTVAVR